MYDSVDAVGVDKQPIKNYNTNYVYLYFFFILIGNLMFMNLFIGVVIDNFK